MIAIRRLSLLIICCTLLVSQISLQANGPVSAQENILTWGIVDTPAPGLGTNIVAASEINYLTISSDDQTFYAVDIPNQEVYKTTDAGLSWPDSNNLPGNLLAAGAQPPTWNIAVAPDDANFLVAITDGSGAPNGPKNVFVSTDGGVTWQNSNVTLPLATDFISCVAVSRQYYAYNRYIAIATRDGTGGGNGTVLTFKAPGPGSWVDQGLLPAGDVVAMKFSPTYESDATIVVVFASAGGLFLNIGTHDVAANNTVWKSGIGFPVKITASDGNSPTNAQIITADLELPSDFSGVDPGDKRRYFVSLDARTNIAPLTYFSGVYRIDDTVARELLYHKSELPSFPDQRIASISYWGDYDSGKLIAGEVTTDAARGLADIWLCLDPLTTSPPPGWKRCNDIKAPTGGGNSGYANALVSWNASGGNVYCGTSSADLTTPGTAWGAGQWPRGLWDGSFALDESAFSLSLDGGEIWNQLSLIDTELTLLSDVAIMEVPEGSQEYSVLYLASINTNGGVVNNFDSIWRSTSDPLGRQWQRILCTLTANNDIILRLNPRLFGVEEEQISGETTGEEKRSKVIVYADRATNDISYSADEGQAWQILYPNNPITDFTLASDLDIYILNDVNVLKGTRSGASWKWSAQVPTDLTIGHNITTPLKNPEGNSGDSEDWVIVGSSVTGEVAWADFSQPLIKFLPLVGQRVRTPVAGDIHVVTDEQFEANKIVYAASNAPNGKMYRWIIGKSTRWDELEPPNSGFYGIVQKSGALYGADDVPTPPETIRGADRTLYPRAPVPPPPEWDDLTTGLPAAVNFTREPSSLKISSNSYISLWAIDDIIYNWATQAGCLWSYGDTLAKNGPWTTSPASGDFIPVDPVTGRANEINFAWRDLSYARAYELEIAKDDQFSQRVLVDENIIPANPLAPSWILLAGSPLEANHKYFWRVRARGATTGEEIRSLWSATMYFTVMAGLPVTSEHLGPVLLQPQNRCTDCAFFPAFSWSPMFQTATYQFVLAKNAQLTQIVEKATVTTTSYQCQEKLEKGATYYWQVQAVKPIISDPSPIGCFTVTEKEQYPGASPSDTSSSILPLIWAGIALYTVFLILLVALIMRTRHRWRRYKSSR